MKTRLFPERDQAKSKALEIYSEVERKNSGNFVGCH